MVVDGHDQGGRDAFLPGMIAERLSQGVAADTAFQIQVADGFFDDTKSIGSIDWMVVPDSAFKNIISFRDPPGPTKPELLPYLSQHEITIPSSGTIPPVRVDYYCRTYW